ncbi:AlpA family transcriptional regulator [Colwellia sp. RSH04]|uniref:helix-turn-helix transcriptional regulator n=1 Tax=Colwellia sp. RSH04 TaxID=2305464 RepID=UPI000E583373|nr:helix-turn-helix domain-containing protein [Colwellia sp. RSH04]RHW76461.1 helix-turn-helix domain-containing protein [Colwellia sp. RSH04]
MKKLLTIDDLAELIQKSHAVIYNMISQGREGEDLPRSIKIGRSRRWPESEVDAWIQHQLDHASDSQKQTPANTSQKTINRV